MTALVLVMLAAVFLVYGPVFKAGFTNYDDDVLVTENPLIRGFTAKNLDGIFLSSYCGLYHPLVLFSYSVEYKLSGLDPLTFHLTNLALHALNTLLVFWLILIVGGNLPAALLTAVLFGIHPVHVESVAWIAERKDVLYALFYLASSLAYLYYVRGNGRTLYYASLLLFLCSLLSKPMAVTLPLLLFLFDFALSRKFDIAGVAEKAPYFLLSAVFGTVTVASQYASPDAAAGPAVSVPAALAGTVNTVIFYLSKLIYPVRLSCFYPYWAGNWKDCFSSQTAVYIIFAALAALFAYSFRRGKSVPFGAAFFLISLLPVLQILPFGQKIPADRYTYLASIGIFYIAARGFALAWQSSNKPLKAAAAFAGAGAVLLLCLAANARCGVWKNSFTLWNDTLEKYPALPQAYKNRADAFKSIGVAGAALADYGRALKLKPGYPQALNNRGNLFASMRDYPSAIEDYSAAVAVNQEYVSAIFNRAIAFEALKKYDEAASDYGLAITKQPRYYEAFNNRGILRARQGDYAKAIDDFTRAAVINPGFNEALANRALAYFKAGFYPESARDVSLLVKRKYPVNPGLFGALIDKKLIK